MKISTMILGVLAVASLAGVAQAAPGAQKAELNAPQRGASPLSPGGTALGSATLFSVVNSDGTVARGDGNGVVTHESTGTYEVLFKRNIVNCAYIATVGLSGTSGASAPGYATVVGRSGQPTGIFLQTFNASGALTDLGFHVFVNC